MISLITRVQNTGLNARMVCSALGTSLGGVGLEFVSAPNPEGLPIIAPTYNRLAERAKGDILLFVHDDIEFVEEGWDARLVETFADGNFDVLGVVGVDKYDGGQLVSAGHPHTFGKFMNRSGNELKVNIYGPRVGSRAMAAADGMFMAVRAEHFKRVKFDEKLDGLFFYDIDYCLRSSTGLVDILVAHYKPPELYGKYPKGMKPMEAYEPYFYAKHDLKGKVKAGDTRALSVSREDYERHGHDALFKLFQEKYKTHANA